MDKLSNEKIDTKKHLCVALACTLLDKGLRERGIRIGYIPEVKAAIIEIFGKAFYNMEVESQRRAYEEWISVKEKLPEERLKVLTVQLREGYDTTVRIETSFYSNQFGWDTEDQSCEKNPTVTHWMPLPSPPKES